MGKVILFVGPSLPIHPDAEWQELLNGVEQWPPAQRGDVLRAVSESPDTIILVDGYYYTVPSVTHKEILYALDQRIRVIGAASMGALRAVELESFGMIGVGQVFEWLRNGVIDGDDEVAILHSPQEFGYIAATVALVDVRRLVERWLAEDLVSLPDVEEILDRIKGLPFGDRDIDRIRTIVAEILGEKRGCEFSRDLRGTSLKQLDTMQALRLAQGCVHPCEISIRLPVTNIFSHYRERYFSPRSPVGQRPTVTYLDAWNLAQIFHPTTAEFVRSVRLRFLLKSAAIQARLKVDPNLKRTVADNLQSRLCGSGDELCLPQDEILQEAEDHSLAEAARAFIGEAEALRNVAQTIGLEDTRSKSVLLNALESQDDLMPSWILLKGFAFTSVLNAALELAKATEEVLQAFEEWSGGPARFSDTDVLNMAAGIWKCTVEDLPLEGGRRGLFQTPGYLPGLTQVLRRIAPAERLGKPINDYEKLKKRLVGTELIYPLVLPS